MFVVPETIVSPAALTIRFKAGALQVDLTEVTAAHLNVTRRDLTTDTWELEIISATASELIAQYTFSENGDDEEIAGTGLYYLAPVLVVPDGNIPARTLTLFVAPQTNVAPNLEETAYLAADVPILGPGAISQEWDTVTDTDSPFEASVVSPFIALDLRNGTIEVTLPEAQDGANFVLTDVYAEAGSNALTLNASGSQQVPVLDGTYATSNTYSSGFPLRLKLSGNLWIPW